MVDARIEDDGDELWLRCDRWDDDARCVGEGARFRLARRRSGGGWSVDSLGVQDFLEAHDHQKGDGANG